MGYFNLFDQYAPDIMTSQNNPLPSCPFQLANCRKKPISLSNEATGRKNTRILLKERIAVRRHARVWNARTEKLYEFRRVRIQRAPCASLITGDSGNKNDAEVTRQLNGVGYAFEGKRPTQ